MNADDCESSGVSDGDEQTKIGVKAAIRNPNSKKAEGSSSAKKGATQADYPSSDLKSNN